LLLAVSHKVKELVLKNHVSVFPRYGSSVDYIQNISEVIYKPVGFGETFCVADSVGHATGSGTGVSAHVDVERGVAHDNYFIGA
jgi:hypothetical protein